MSNTYAHLTHSQRCQISSLIATRTSQKRIAKIMGCNRSTIVRELKRNGTPHRYQEERAHQKAVVRRQVASRRPVRFTPERQQRVIRHLHQKWSPEQIAGRLKHEDIHIRYETIYRFIRHDKKTGWNAVSDTASSG